jgi:hypothetical protein
MQTMTRNDGLRATGAHVSVIAQITLDELRKLIGETEIANGFLNRYMLVAVRRSKYLPDGGAPSDSELQTLASVLGDVAGRARSAGRMSRDADATHLWHTCYRELSDSPGGLLGKALSRAAPHVVRLSCLYALLDGLDVVRLEHLEAALVAWRYVDDSTRFFLEKELGDPLADLILDSLNRAPQGMMRTEFHKLGQGHIEAAKLTAALQRLANEGLALGFSLPGRRGERWFAARFATNASAGLQFLPMGVIA